ncbi:heme biosynthesis HemY N-terminal domain-containing protein [Vreelandella utahensis]|uniref:heme biosynthesis HemY N-terminal domain-containing protein n=1 Tax=Vreelandella halophila TaxID=86177 RepID=UPI0009861A3D|nr:heme biosynthesis HemY N-terminal domain-containing protein [Halomonas utahensis]
MRRLLIVLFVAVLAGTLLSLGMAEDPGYIRVSIGTWLIETNFWVGMSLVVLAALALHWLLDLLRGLRLGPGAMGQWWRNSGRRRARRQTTRGLLELAEGNWGRARKLLEQGAGNAETPLINYLSAAEAAHQQGDQEEADRFLRLAWESTSGSDLAVGLTQARLQLNAGRNEQALATLLRLRRKSPNHPHVMRQLANVYRNLEDWQALSELLPELRRQAALDDSSLTVLEQEVWLNVLDQAAERLERQPPEQRNLDHLDRVWDQLPPPRRRDESVVHHYADHLARLGAESRAESLLRKVLRQNWSDLLINLYGRIQGPREDEQLLAAEGWLKERPNNPELLLALGRISLRNRLWGKAREYLETSLGVRHSQETAAELCRLYAHLGRYEDSVRLLRQGVLEHHGLPRLPMPEARRRSGTPAR